MIGYSGRTPSPIRAQQELSLICMPSVFLKFPDRRVARTPYRIERDAVACLTSMAFDLKPAVPATKALSDARRGCAGPPQPPSPLNRLSHE
jgi:hypothetical protein